MMTSTRTETDTFGPIEVASDRLLGRPGTSVQPRQFQDRLGEAAAQPVDPGPGHRQAGRRPQANMELQAAWIPQIGNAAIIAAAQEVIDGKLDAHFPLVGLADRFGHPVQHERQ